VASPRVPMGCCYLYHANDSQAQVVPSGETSPQGDDGRHQPGPGGNSWPWGNGNSLTRIVLKPTHLVGGYAQLSYAPDYYGPTGAQRDQRVLVRRRPGEQGGGHR